MPIKFLSNEPALFLEDKEIGRILVLADLHLGIESELFDNGIIVAPQSKKLHDQIMNLINLVKADKLIILGDFKHKIPGITFRELREIPKFMKPLSEKVEVVLVRGNHDTELEGLIPENVKIYGSKGFSIGNYGFFHGHSWPKKDILRCDHLFTAHIHPTVEFVDKLGFGIVEKVWVKGNLNPKVIKEKYKIRKSENFKFGKLETTIFPAFNPLITGIPLNRRQKDIKYIGPLLRSGALKLNKSYSFMLDGTILGKLSDI